MERKKQEDKLADVPHNIFENRWRVMSPEEKRRFLDKYTYEEYWGRS
jgi:hypothetical protein